MLGQSTPFEPLFDPGCISISAGAQTIDNDLTQQSKYENLPTRLWRP